jgi:hypothetical protein
VDGIPQVLSLLCQELVVPGATIIDPSVVLVSSDQKKYFIQTQNGL